MSLTWGKIPGPLPLFCTESGRKLGGAWVQGQAKHIITLCLQRVLDSSLPHLWVTSAQSWWGWLAGVSPLPGPQNPHFCSPSPIPLWGWRIEAKNVSGYSLTLRLLWKHALRTQSYRHQTRDGWTFKWPCSLGRCALFRNIYTSSRVFHPLSQPGANTFLEESLFV